MREVYTELLSATLVDEELEIDPDKMRARCLNGSETSFKCTTRPETKANSA